MSFDINFAAWFFSSYLKKKHLNEPFEQREPSVCTVLDVSFSCCAHIYSKAPCPTNMLLGVVIHQGVSGWVYPIIGTTFLVPNSINGRLWAALRPGVSDWSHHMTAMPNLSSSLTDINAQWSWSWESNFRSLRYGGKSYLGSDCRKLLNIIMPQSSVYFRSCKKSP